MISYNLILLFLGLYLVIKGADILITCSISLGKKLGLSELIIGIAIIGFGTSLPELLVSVDAVLNKAPELSLGNILGSNIANIFLVLGFAALVKKIKLQRIDNFDNYFHVLSHILFFLTFLFLKLNIFFGLSFLFLFSLYLFLSLKKAKSNKSNIDIDIDNNKLGLICLKRPYAIGFPCIILSIIVTLFGAQLTVDTSIAISIYFGVSESFIGLTIIAIGTSLPEIATGVAAAKKGRVNLIVGNILGSNIYNLLLILGFISLFESFTYDKLNLLSEVLILTLSVFLFWYINHKKKLINWKYAMFFLVVYILYLLNLFSKNFF